MEITKQTQKPLDWAFQRKAKSAFRNPVNRSSYAPKSNTPGLYDGSSEARAIMQGALEQTLSVETEALRTLQHALDYLKGRDLEPTTTP